MQSNLKRKKFHRTNQGSNFLEGSFSNRDSLRVPIQFIRENQPQHLKICFFLKIRAIHFYINSTSVFRPVKRNWLNFPSIEINTPLPALVPQCLLGQIQVQTPILVAAKYQIPNHTFRVESSIISIDSNITSSGRSLLYSRKSVGPRMDP